MLSLGLSFFPWGLPVLLVFGAAVARSYVCLLALVVVAAASILNEFMLKPAIGQPRPPTTACRRPDGSLRLGMPSGHMLIVQVAAVVFTFEAAFHLDALQATSVGIALLVCSSSCGWARWYNGDHSASQVIVSFFLGSIFGSAAAAFDRLFIGDAYRDLGLN